MTISNTQKRFKPTPIQNWRASYNYLSKEIRALKDATRTDADWGGFKRPKKQRSVHVLQAMARELMSRRDSAVENSRRQQDVA